MSTVGDIMMHVGGYHEYHGSVQYYGDIMSTMGVFSTMEGYHGACEGIS